MRELEGRVAIVTGAGRGIGREHALLFASEGAKVVVNDLGGSTDGAGADTSPAQQVVDEIVAAGGSAIANFDDVADWDGARSMVEQAVDTFGDLHVLVNNAGILRDRMLVNMSAEEWDAVIRVHLRGHFCPTRWASAYWREQSKSGREGKRSVINTSSASGLFGNSGQTNYGAAKIGIATFSMIADGELRRYGVRVNAIAPAAATRLTSGLSPEVTEPPGEGWSPTGPENIAPFVAYLATEDCPIHGRIFLVAGGTVRLFQPFSIIDAIEKEGLWSVGELKAEAARFADVPFNLNNPYEGQMG
ncbi:MAG TPA: SDR family oxidoreductase [Acidimicrobiales bacterium]|nr:SDR family oxidoreductase [Acidimicrobiales bacterium]